MHIGAAIEELKISGGCSPASCKLFLLLTDQKCEGERPVAYVEVHELSNLWLPLLSGHQILADFLIW